MLIDILVVMYAWGVIGFFIVLERDNVDAPYPKMLVSAANILWSLLWPLKVLRMLYGYLTRGATRR